MQLTDKSALELFIQRLAILAPIDEQNLEILRTLLGSVTQVRANADAVAPGQLIDHVCIVVDGLLASFVQLRDGNRQITALHIIGDAVNLHSVAKPQAAAAVQALTTTVMICIPHAEFRRITSASRAIGDALWAYSATNTATLAQWTVNVGRRAAQARLAHLLCEMALRMEAAGQGDRSAFELAATQAHLGDALGLTTVHVNRTLKRLRAAGMLTIDYRTVCILDWPALTHAGDFDPTYLQLDLPVKRAA